MTTTSTSNGSHTGNGHHRPNPTKGRGSLADEFRTLSEELNALWFRGKWLASHLRKDDEAVVHAIAAALSVEDAGDHFFMLAVGVRDGRYRVVGLDPAPDPDPEPSAVVVAVNPPPPAAGSLRNFEVLDRGPDHPGHVQFAASAPDVALAKAARDWPGLEIAEVVEPSKDHGARKGSDGRPKSLPSATETIREPVVLGSEVASVDGPPAEVPDGRKRYVAMNAFKRPMVFVRAYSLVGAKMTVALARPGMTLDVEQDYHEVGVKSGLEELVAALIHEDEDSLPGIDDDQVVDDELHPLDPVVGRDPTWLLPEPAIAGTNSETEDDSEELDASDYSPSHPWYYKRGGKPLSIEAIEPTSDVLGRARESILANMSIKGRKGTNLEKLRGILKASEMSLLTDARKYQELVDNGWSAMSEREQNRGSDSRCSDLDDALSLKHNHILYNKAQVAAASKLIAEAEATCALLHPPKAEGKAKGKKAKPALIAVPKAIESKPDWRPLTLDQLAARGWPARLLDLLEDCDVEDAGEAWRLIESGWFTSDAAWEPAEARELEISLVELRHDLGDPAPMTAPFEEGLRTGDSGRKDGGLGREASPESSVLSPPGEKLDTDDLLLLALHRRAGMSERWEAMARDGGSDLEIRAALGRAFDLGLKPEGKPGGTISEPGGCCSFMGDHSPKFWSGKTNWSGRPTLESSVLVDRVRRVLAIPLEDGSTPAPKPSRRAKAKAKGVAS